MSRAGPLVTPFCTDCAVRMSSNINFSPPRNCQACAAAREAFTKFTEDDRNSHGLFEPPPPPPHAAPRLRRGTGPGPQDRAFIRRSPRSPSPPPQKPAQKNNTELVLGFLLVFSTAFVAGFAIGFEVAQRM